MASAANVTQTAEEVMALLDGKMADITANIRKSVEKALKSGAIDLNQECHRGPYYNLNIILAAVLPEEGRYFEPMGKTKQQAAQINNIRAFI